VAFLAQVTIPPEADQGFSVLSEPHAFWDTFARYDSGWYYGIASQGYAYLGEGRNNIAFFPLYPLLMRAGGQLLGGRQEDFYFAGVVVSWLAFAFAMALLYRLARLDLPPESSQRAVLYCAVFPSAFFFGVVYSESLFLLTLVGAVVALRERRWWLAAVAGAAMTATRVNGVMFTPALAWIAWQSAPPDTRSRTTALAAAGASLIGIGLYTAFTFAISGTVWAWYSSITHWGYFPGGNPMAGLFGVGRALVADPYTYLVDDPLAPYDSINFVAAAFALLTVPFVWMRFGFGYVLVIVLGLSLPLSSGQPEGLARYCAVLFPMPVLLGSLQGETRHHGLMGLSLMLYTTVLIFFVTVRPMF
jgi:hypothetical protein